MNFAVVEIAGKQFLVQENETIETPKLPGVIGEKVSFPRVLLYWDGKKASIGRPILEGFAVEGKIVKFDKSPKLVVYKFKKRKDSHRKRGHRQDFCAVAIEKIIIPGKVEAPVKEEKIAAAEKKQPVKKTSPVPAIKKDKKAPSKKPAAVKKPAAKKKSPEKD